MTKKLRRNKSKKTRKQKGGDINTLEQYILTRLDTAGFNDYIRVPNNAVNKIKYGCTLGKTEYYLYYLKAKGINMEDIQIFRNAIFDLLRKYHIAPLSREMEEYYPMQISNYENNVLHENHTIINRQIRDLYNAYLGILPPLIVEQKRTRSTAPIEGDLAEYQMLPNYPKKSVNAITLEPTKQGVPRITLSDGKEYTLDEIKDMWKYSKDQTPLRHPYTEEDKQKIQDFINFAKGGKKRRHKRRKTRKQKK